MNNKGEITMRIIKYSLLQNQLLMLEIEHNYRVEMLNYEYESKKSELILKCTHKYEDGTSAFIFKGAHPKHYEKCSICGKHK